MRKIKRQDIFKTIKQYGPDLTLVMALVPHMIRHLDELVKQEKMTSREVDVIKEVYGICQVDLTHKEIGLNFGVTGPRIMQIRNKAFRKLRHPSRTELWRYPR